MLAIGEDACAPEAPSMIQACLSELGREIDELQGVVQALDSGTSFLQVNSPTLEPKNQKEPIPECHSELVSQLNAVKGRLEQTRYDIQAIHGRLDL